MKILELCGAAQFLSWAQKHKRGARDTLRAPHCFWTDLGY
jgi:hypothetical protein